MIRAVMFTVMGVGVFAVVVMLVVWASNRTDPLSDRTRKAKLRSQLDEQREISRQLRRRSGELAAALHETRATLRQISKTAVSEDDRLLAGHQADAIGELLIDHATRGDEVSSQG